MKIYVKKVISTQLLFNIAEAAGPLVSSTYLTIPL